MFINDLMSIYCFESRLWSTNYTGLVLYLVLWMVTYTWVSTSALSSSPSCMEAAVAVADNIAFHFTGSKNKCTANKSGYNKLPARVSASSRFSVSAVRAG